MKVYAKEFEISVERQRSAGWYRERAGKPSASALGTLFDTKANGEPSSKAREYLKQLAFERKFDTIFERFQTKAMADGTFFEDFTKQVYERETGNKLVEAFSYISDWFVATPDALVAELEVAGKRRQRGLLECKVVGDSTFMEIAEKGIPLDHELQMQGQMMATGFDWVDYIVVNLKTRAYLIIRLKRNNKLIKRIYERLHEPLDFPEFQNFEVKRFDDNLLQEYMGNSISEETTTIDNLGF